MKVEVTVADRGTITIKSEVDFDKPELLDMARSAVRWLKGVEVPRRRSFGFIDRED